MNSVEMFQGVKDCNDFTHTCLLSMSTEKEVSWISFNVQINVFFPNPTIHLEKVTENMWSKMIVLLASSRNNIKIITSL